MLLVAAAIRQFHGGQLIRAMKAYSYSTQINADFQPMPCHMGFQSAGFPEGKAPGEASGVQRPSLSRSIRELQQQSLKRRIMLIKEK